MLKTKKVGIYSVLGFVLVLLLFFASYPIYLVADFYEHLEQFNHSIKNGDRNWANDNLEKIKKDYGKFTDWRLRGLADKLLFHDMHLYEAEVSALNEDYEKVEKEDLKDRQGWRESYLLGTSRFGMLQNAYQSAMVSGNRAKMALILGIVIERVASDFERCVKEGPGPVDNFNCSFNYDLLTDSKTASRSLANPKPKPRYILRRENGDTDQGRGKSQKKDSLKPGPSDGKEPGQGGAKKVG